MTHLIDNGAQSSMIKSYTSMIKHILNTDGYAWDDQKMMLTAQSQSTVLLSTTHLG